MATIAEVLHRAADEFLWDGFGPIGTKEYASCLAICRAMGRAEWDTYKPYGPVFTGLRRLGLDPRTVGAFNEFEPNEERQGARYAWLKFAALIAEEQGV
jgi:hypothetical protein